MKVLVSIKRVIDYNVKIKIKSDHSAVELNNTKMSINPFCEIGVEEAVRLKEKNKVSEVIIVSVGPEVCQEQIRTALALGADRGILVKTDGREVSSLGVAKLLKAIIDKEAPELIILGKQAIDSDNNQTGQMLAGICGFSQGTFASKITLEKDHVEVIREVDGGLQTLSLTLPSVITTDLRLNEPRYASLPNIMKAKSKSIEILTPEDLSVTLVNTLEVISIKEPDKREVGIKVDDINELVNKLKTEAKVL